jgi:hypothetical protein
LVSQTAPPPQGVLRWPFYIHKAKEPESRYKRENSDESSHQREKKKKKNKTKRKGKKVQLYLCVCHSGDIYQADDGGDPAVFIHIWSRHMSGSIFVSCQTSDKFP